MPQSLFTQLYSDENKYLDHESQHFVQNSPYYAQSVPSQRYCPCMTCAWFHFERARFPYVFRSGTQVSDTYIQCVARALYLPLGRPGNGTMDPEVPENRGANKIPGRRLLPASSQSQRYCQFSPRPSRKPSSSHTLSSLDSSQLLYGGDIGHYEATMHSFIPWCSVSQEGKYGMNMSICIRHIYMSG